MRKNFLFGFAVGVGITFLISLIAVICLHRTNNVEIPSVIGTFCFGDAVSGARCYVTFEADGNYCIWEQYQILSEGKWNQLDEQVVHCISENADVKANVIVTNCGNPVWITPDMRCTALEKISEVPIYINVKVPESEKDVCTP